MLDVLSIRPEAPGPASPVVLMVSGGSDSTALLVRAATGELDLADGRGPVRLARERLCVLHVNHQIRGAEADVDEAFVCELASSLGVACRCVRVDIPARVAATGGNLEELARQARYDAAWELVRELSAAASEEPARARVAVAHTADDRAETFLMRAMTGAGAGALAGLRPLRGLVVRPLLGETREGLRAYLRARGVGWREDSTNEQDDALRSYVRHHVTPPMRRRVPAFAQVLGRSLDVLAEEDELLEAQAAELLARAARPAPAGLRDALASAGGPEGPAPAPASVPASPRELRRARRAACLDADVLAGAPLPLTRRALRQALAALLGPDDARRARVEARHVAWLAELARTGEGSCNLPLGMRAACVSGLLVIEAPLASCAGGASAADDRRARASTPAAEPAAAPSCVCLPVPGSAAWEGRTLAAELVAVPEGCADVRAFVRSCVRELSEARGRALAEGRDVAFVDAHRARTLAPANVVPDVPGAPAACPDTPLALCVRGAHTGERVSPQGMRGHTKLVFDLLMEAGVPACARTSWPVVCAASLQGEGSVLAGAQACGNQGQTSPVSCGGVVWVAGIRTDARVAYDAGTRVLLRLELVSERK